MQSSRNLTYRNMSINFNGKYNKEPSARCLPLAEVIEEDIARASDYARPTPKCTAERREAGRRYGQRVYDNVYTMRPMPSIYGRVLIHRIGALAVAQKKALMRTLSTSPQGGGVFQKSADVSPAAGYGQRRSFLRMRNKKNVTDPDVVQLYEGYYSATSDAGRMSKMVYRGRMISNDGAHPWKWCEKEKCDRAGDRGVA